MVKHTLEYRLEKARQLRAEGYNCSQCVMMVFDDITGMDLDTAARMAIGLGGGIGGQKMTCGTITAMSMIAGAATYKTPADKRAIYENIHTLCDEFNLKNGALECAVLKFEKKIPCINLIEQTIILLHGRFAE